MALLSYKLIEEIIDVAETYARQEKARMNQLDDEGKPLPRNHAKPKAGNKPQGKAAG